MKINDKTMKLLGTTNNLIKYIGYMKYNRDLKVLDKLESLLQREKEC
jgi:hypothetical protein